MDVPQMLETCIVTGGMGTVLMYLNNRATTEPDLALLGYLACSFLLILLHQVAPLFHTSPAQRPEGIYRSASSQGLWSVFMIPSICVLAAYSKDNLDITPELLFILLTLTLSLVHYNPTNSSQIAGALLLVWLKEIFKEQGFVNLRMCVFYCILYYALLSRLPQKFPRSFSYGECTVVIQSSLLIATRFFHILFFEKSDTSSSTSIPELVMIKIAMLSVLGIILATTLLQLMKDNQWKWKFYLAYSLAASVCIAFGLPRQNPVAVLIHYVTEDYTRLYLIAWSLTMTLTTVIFTIYQKTVTTATRKFFHVVIVVIYIPGLWLDPWFLFISSLIAFCVLFVIETVRYMGVPPLGLKIKEKYELFIDRQDQGPLALTPLYLILGLSLPLWLSFILKQPVNHISVYAGVLSVGIGDAAASVVGSRIGKIKLPGSAKTVEGTLASLLSQLVTLYCLKNIDAIQFTWTIQLFTSVLATTVLETATSQIDNLVLPLFMYTCLIIKI